MQNVYQMADDVFRMQRRRRRPAHEKDFCRRNPTIFKWDYFLTEFDSEGVSAMGTPRARSNDNNTMNASSSAASAASAGGDGHGHGDGGEMHNIGGANGSPKGKFQSGQGQVSSSSSSNHIHHQGQGQGPVRGWANTLDHPPWLRRIFCNSLWVSTFLSEYTEVIRLSLEGTGTKPEDVAWHLLPCYEFLIQHFCTVLRGYDVMSFNG